jgi:anaerobic magnesium-protoporphyrin IX monomethyl ester cyclase
MIRLIFPPQGHFTQPYLALPCLKAYLQQHGYADVGLIDASIEAYDRFLSPEYLRFAAERAERRLTLERLDSGQELPFADQEAFRAAAEARVAAPALIAGVEAAKRIVRGEQFYDTTQYVPAIRTLYHGLRLVSAAWFPTQLTPHNFSMAYGIDRSEQVLAALRDEEQNPFIEHFQRTLLPRLLADKPRLVGLSIIYGSQLIPALTLGRLIKQHLPECHVTAGGGFLAYIGKKLLAVPAFADCLDSIIFYEGEAPLLALAQALERGESLGQIGSLGWFDPTAKGQPAIINPLGHPIKLDEAPIPAFDGLPFEKYFSPRIVLPYDINRGCYYGECAFCTLPTVIGPGYRTRSAKHIVGQVLALKERYGASDFNFITDCMPPGMIRDLPQELIDRQANIRWWCDARVEPKAYDLEGAKRLYRAGCRKLLFGFETATPRLLKLMQKGQSLKSTLEVAKNCADAGISVTFYAMVGFPTETREEAQATLDFLVQNRDVVREVSLQTFHIDEVAKTYREAAEFGLEILSDPSADLQLYHDYRSASGMTQTEAAEMFEELMAGLRANLPIFAGDNLYYFMQKSHYFLHLARDISPDAFVDLCRNRQAKRVLSSDDPAQRQRLLSLMPRDGLRSIALNHSYNQVAQTLAHPLARAIRPDFLTGRFLEGARQAAAAQLAPVPRRQIHLTYAPGGYAEFVELTPDGLATLEAIGAAGSLGRLFAAHPELSRDAQERLLLFVSKLHRLGLFAEPAQQPRQATPAHA